MISRPAVRYYGGKWRLAPWIIKHFPLHDLYVEPFGGAGSVILQKPRIGREVYNDLDGEVVNFFSVLRSRQADLIRAIKLTPYSRSEHDLSSVPCVDVIERARRFYVFQQQSHNCGSKKKPGWRSDQRAYGLTPYVQSWRSVEHLWCVADRLLDVIIESDDATSIIERYDHPDTLFYVDPPYPKGVRKETRDAYFHEMTDRDHEDLLILLNKIEGNVVVSGYTNIMYEAALHEWERYETKARTAHSGARLEVIWVKTNESKSIQPGLFD